MSEVIPPPPPLPEEDRSTAPPASTNVPVFTVYSEEQIKTLEINLKSMEQELEMKKHELESQKFEFDRLKWRQEQLLKDREWDHARNEEWRERVAASTNAAYFHRHHLTDKAIWLYLGSLSERSGSGRPTSVNQVLDEFWSVYGTLQSLIVRAPFEGTHEIPLHDVLDASPDAEEHF